MKINGKHIMFKASAISITPYEVVKETNARVTFKQERIHFGNDEKTYFEDSQNKSGAYHQWTETFTEAKQYLIDKSEAQIKRLTDSIERENNTLQYVSNLAEPVIIVNTKPLP